MLSDEGARAFAVAHGVELVDSKDLITPKAMIRFREIKEFVPSVEKEFVEGSKL